MLRGRLGRSSLPGAAAGTAHPLSGCSRFVLPSWLQPQRKWRKGKMTRRSTSRAAEGNRKKRERVVFVQEIISRLWLSSAAQPSLCRALYRAAMIIIILKAGFRTPGSLKCHLEVACCCCNKSKKVFCDSVKTRRLGWDHPVQVYLEVNRLEQNGTCFGAREDMR